MNPQWAVHAHSYSATRRHITRMSVADGSLTLRSRLAWVYDFDLQRRANAAFLAIPDARLLVQGATQSYSSAVTSAAVEMKWWNGFSAMAVFDGESSAVSRSYSGKGMLRYQW